MRTLLALLVLVAIVKVMADPISNLQSAAAAAAVNSQPVVENAAAPAASVSQNGVTPAEEAKFRQTMFSYLRAKGRFTPKVEYCSQFVDQYDCELHYDCCGCVWYDQFLFCNHF